MTILRVVAVAVWVEALALWLINTSYSPDVGSLPIVLRILVDVFGAVLSLIAIPGSLVLWVSMIYYWRHYDSRTGTLHVAWLPLLLFGFCFGASIYCWAVVSQQYQRVCSQRIRAAASDRGIQVIKRVTLFSLLLTGILVFFSAPAHPIIPEYFLAGTAFVLVPIDFLGVAFWAFWAVFSKAK